MTQSATLSYGREVGRKGLHLLALCIPAGMWWVGMPQALYVLGPAALLAVGADVARSRLDWFNRAIRTVFGPLMRPEELPPVGRDIRFNGATCVLVGAALLAVLFPIRLAVPVLTMTMLADAAAALVGLQWGRHPWGTLSATLEGSAAFVVTGLAVLSFFPGIPWPVALVGVGAGTVLEAAPLPINDNIRVPIGTALVIAAMETVFFGRAFPLFGGLAA